MFRDCLSACVCIHAWLGESILQSVCCRLRSGVMQGPNCIISCDYITIMSKLRLTDDVHLTYKTSYNYRGINLP